MGDGGRSRQRSTAVILRYPHAPEAKLPGDRRLAEALEAVEQRAPSGGPTLQRE